jgi:hypothetical protein
MFLVTRNGIQQPGGFTSASFIYPETVWNVTAPIKKTVEDAGQKYELALNPGKYKIQEGHEVQPFRLILL